MRRSCEEEDGEGEGGKRKRGEGVEEKGEELVKEMEEKGCRWMERKQFKRSEGKGWMETSGSEGKGVVKGVVEKRKEGVKKMGTGRE